MYSTCVNINAYSAHVTLPNKPECTTRLINFIDSFPISKKQGILILATGVLMDLIGQCWLKYTGHSHRLARNLVCMQAIRSCMACIPPSL